MSLNLAGILVGLGLAVLGYIQYLRSKLLNQRAENATLQTQVEEKEWKAVIDQVSKKVTESEKDFRDSVDDFNRKYPDDGDGKS